MEDSELEEYLTGVWHDTEGSHQRHLALRDEHTVALTDNAPGTFEWAAPKIARYLKDEERVLDIGCGGGQYLTFLLSHPGLISLGVGLDRHDRLADEVWPRLENYSQAALVRGNALDLPFDDNSFTAAMANRMLNQTRNIARALAEASRVLKPEGLLFIVTADSEHRSLLREIHEANQQALSFPSAFYSSSTPPDQRLNLENGPDWLSAHFEEIRLERYERVMIFTRLPEILDYYATGLLFHRADGFGEVERWRQLYRAVAERLKEILEKENRIEIREGAALFIAKNKAKDLLQS